MSETERITIENYVRGYLDPALCDGHWLAHHIRMNHELYTREAAANPSLTIDEFLAQPYTSLNSKKRKR
jgi:hypothetical protein